VAQRAYENLFRIECAHERNVDVTTAFEIFRNTNVLNTAGRVSVEPLLRVNAVALDGNQSATSIRSSDADRDFVAAVVLRVVKLHLELGILFERPRDSATTDHTELQSGETSILVVAKFEDIIAWLLGGECVVKAVGRNRNLCRFRDTLFQNRLVSKVAILLL